jgi:hypothetical protein
MISILAILLLGILLGGFLFGGDPGAQRGCLTVLLVLLGVVLMFRILLWLFFGIGYRRRFAGPGILERDESHQD